MSATRSRPRTRSGARTRSRPRATTRPRTRSGARGAPGSRPRSGRRGPAGSARPGLSASWRNALEGAAAALCAVVAMTAVAALALALLGAGAVGSPWSLTMAVTAMAVGGSASAGPGVSEDAGSAGSGLAEMFGGGGMSPSISGAADAVPLGVTLVGALVLWLVFFRRLPRRLVAGELVARAAGAGAAALLVLTVVAALGQGTVTMPSSAMSRLGGDLGGDQDSGQAAGGIGELLGDGDGLATTYEVHVGSAAGGAVLWAAVTLAVGVLISRRVVLPLGGGLDRLRDAWAPSLTTVVRTILVLAVVPLVLLVCVGTVVGGRAGTAAGAALLFAPNALAVFLTLGVGSPWTAGAHPVESAGDNPMAALLGGMGGGTQPTAQLDRTERLVSLSAGGWPLWSVALTVTGILLLGCAYAAARRGNPAHARPVHPYRGPLARHLGLAERFGVVTAAVLVAASWLAGASGRFGISTFGSELAGTRAELSGSVLWTAAFGLLLGSLAGFAGSLAAASRGDRGTP